MKKKVSEVFTPRNAAVNERMYIHRSDLEVDFSRALEDGRNIILLGESGNGKTWLYRKVLNGNGRFIVANCALATSLGSLTKVIEAANMNSPVAEKVGYKEQKKAGIGFPGIADAGVQHEGSFAIVKEEALLATFKKISSSIASAPLVVLENLEKIFDSDHLMDELASIILLLDDPKYADTGVKFLIVGTPAGVIDYFSKVKNMASVANRLIELPRVGGLSGKQVEEFVRRGFISELGVSLSDSEVITIADHVDNVTLGIAQRVHEYCACLGYCIEDNDGRYDAALLGKADGKWLNEGIRHSYAVIQANLSGRVLGLSRKDQVIYAIGRIKAHQFDISRVDGVVRRNFSNAVRVRNLGIGPILRGLCTGEEPLLVSDARTGNYRIKDPRYLMCIRLVLGKDSSTGQVVRKAFSVG